MAMSISFSHNGDVWNCVIWLFVNTDVTQQRQYRKSDIAAIPKSTLLDTVLAHGAGLLTL
jgi:hypothetical protein